jgi:hypothetical protein
MDLPMQSKWWYVDAARWCVYLGAGFGLMGWKTVARRGQHAAHCCHPYCHKDRDYLG